MKTTAMSALALALCVLTPLVPAQTSIGPGTPGTGGLIPTLSCGHAYMGNSSFSLNVGNGYGGAVAYVGASFAQGLSLFGGAQILIDLNPINNFLIAPVPLSGPAGVAGAGAAPYPSPRPVITLTF